LYPRISQRSDIGPQLKTLINIVPYRINMSEEKKRSGKKISAWIPQEMYDKLVTMGYNSPTEAIISGLNLLLNVSDGGQNITDGGQWGTQSDKRETEGDSAETRELRARVEELQNHNETLKAEVGRAAQDKEAIQNLYNNYMLQMQTLINQKAIEAPGEKKKPFWKFW